MPVSQGPPPRKGSLESGRFEGAEAEKASMLTDRVSVTGSHFNDSGGRPLQRRKGHPGLQQGQHVARKELRGGNSYHPRWLPSVGVRAQGLPSQGTFGGEQAPVPGVSSPSRPRLSAGGHTSYTTRDSMHTRQAAGGGAAE